MPFWPKLGTMAEVRNKYGILYLDGDKETTTKKIQIGNVTKTVLSSGKFSLSTKKESPKASGGGLRFEYSRSRVMRQQP